MMRNFLLIFLFIAICECYRSDRHYHEQHENESFNRGGIKSYGGYFSDSTGQNQAASNFVSTQNYQQPAVTSYGWNFNQPSRTYGGVNYLQTRVDNGNAAFPGTSNNNNNIGWNTGNNYNTMPSNPFFPKFPQMPLFPFPQFQFPTFQFPNFSPYPNVYNNQPNYQYGHGQAPYPQQPNHPMPDPNYQHVGDHQRPISPQIPHNGNHQRPISPQIPQRGAEGIHDQTSTLDHRYNKDNRGQFATDSFFANTDNREWTEEQEAKWQATTKAPFFENTVPGLGCTLPAASILGAKDVFSAIELLPLIVPPNKPILSCNATEVKQTQVKIDDKIYSCSNQLINIQCLENSNSLQSNSCPGKILICDMGSSKDITCTNGTLISKLNLECGSISLGNPKSTLNCEMIQPVDVDYIPPDTTTRQSIRKPTRASTTTEIPENFDYDEFQQGVQQVDRIDTLPIEENENDLMPQVKKAMENIFPHDLLVKPSTRLQPPKPYLPPYETSASRDLKNSLIGIFPMDLLAISKGGVDTVTVTESSFDVRLSAGSSVNNQQKTSTSNVGINKRPNIDDIGFKTELTGSSGGIDTRFGGNSNSNNNNNYQDFRDRLIFSN